MFVAIELPEEARDAYRGHGRRLAPLWPTARWTRPEDIHLTLCFIGDVDEGRVPDLAAALEKAAEATGPFTLVQAGLELAPPGRRPPTMIWASFAESAAFARLALAVRRAAEPFAAAMPAAKDVLPHATLARLRSAGTAAGSGDALEPMPGPLPVTVSGFSLIESRLTPAGPIYSEIKRYDLIRSV